MQKLANLIENGSLKNLAQNTVTCADYGSFSESVVFEICRVGAPFATTELLHKYGKLAALKRRLFVKPHLERWCWSRLASASWYKASSFETCHKIVDNFDSARNFSELFLPNDAPDSGLQNGIRNAWENLKWE